MARNRKSNRKQNTIHDSGMNASEAAMLRAVFERKASQSSSDKARRYWADAARLLAPHRWRSVAARPDLADRMRTEAGR